MSTYRFKKHSKLQERQIEMCRNIIIKFLKSKDKEKNLKYKEENGQITLKKTTTKMTADFVKEIMKARRQQDIFKVIEENICQTRIFI